MEEASEAADLSIRITGEGSCAKEPGQLETPDSRALCFFGVQHTPLVSSTQTS